MSALKKKRIPVSNILMDISQTCPRHEGLEEKFETVIVKLEGIEKSIEKQFEYVEAGIKSAKSDMERRLEGMNEFRTQLAKQAAEFITRQELQLMFDKQGVRIDGLADKLGVSRETLSMTTGSSSMSQRIVLALVALGSSMFTGVILLVIRAVFKG